MRLSNNTTTATRKQPPPPLPLRRKPPSGRTNLASCVVATIFLIFVVIVILILYFTLLKPQSPQISVNAVQLPTFSTANGTINFTFSQYISVKNPNRAVFSHYDSSLQLLHSGRQVGFMFIPAGKIDSGRTQYLAATFSVQSFPISPAPSPAEADPMNVGPNVTDGLAGFRVGGTTMELESKLEMAGRVRLLHFFEHRVETQSDCRVAIAVSDGSVLGFHC